MDNVRERAAIKEYSGNIPRAKAEMQAKAASIMCLTCRHGYIPLDKQPCESCGSMKNWEKKS